MANPMILQKEKVDPMIIRSSPTGGNLFCCKIIGFAISDSFVLNAKNSIEPVRLIKSNTVNYKTFYTRQVY